MVSPAICSYSFSCRWRCWYITHRPEMETSFADDHELHILRGNPSFIFLMLFTSTVDYTNGRLMTSYPLRKRLFLTLSIVTNLDSIGFFKYFNFGIENYNAWRYGSRSLAV